MKDSKIEWTDHTFNPWEGCTKVSPGCAHCYAETRNQRWAGGKNWGPGAPRRRTSAANWKQPLKWNDEQMMKHRAGEMTDHRPRVFCASLADWLDHEVPAEWLADLLRVIACTPNLDWLLLTKRPQNWEQRLRAAAVYLQTSQMGHTNDPAWRLIDQWLPWNGVHRHAPPDNIWIGTTVEDQPRADERIPHLLKIPARVRFLSCEPLLGPVEFSNVTNRSDCVAQLGKPALGGIHWVICGGESGPGARPMHPGWARSLSAQCAAVNVAFFFKQWGEWLPLFDATASPEHVFPDGERVFRVGKKSAGRLLDGREWNDFP